MTDLERGLLLAPALLGHVALYIYALNTAHGREFNSRWLNLISLALVAAGSLASLAFGLWLGNQPVAHWPWWAIALLLPGWIISLVVLPAVTLARLLRRMPYVKGRRALDLDFENVRPRSEAIGSGWRARLLAIPANQSLQLRIEDWLLAGPDLRPAFDKLELLLVADIHLTRAYRPAYFEWAFDQIAGWTPDAVLLLGDVVDDPGCYNWIRPLLARLPQSPHRYAILGNHDNLYDANRIASEIRRSGFEVLDGTWTTFEHRGARIAIGGTYHPWGPQPPFGLHDPADATILLSHSPDYLYTAAKNGVDLMLSGHNHGGQVRLPLFGPILMPSRYSRRFEWGYYRHDTTLLYVSRGLGAQIPLRLGCPPELTRVRFRVRPRPEPAIPADR